MEAAVAVQPALTFLNMSGDVTIAWDESNREQIIELVRRKMAQGYSFFVLTPRVIPVLGNKKVKLKKESQLDKAVGIVVPDDQIDALVAQLGDVDVADAVRHGHAGIAKAPSSRKLDSTRRAKTAEEVVTSQCVAVRPVVGG